MCVVEDFSAGRAPLKGEEGDVGEKQNVEHERAKPIISSPAIA